MIRYLGKWGCVSRGTAPIPSCPFLPTRLTAFVLKVLSMAQEQVGGSPEKLQETASWLLSQQQADGSFQDPRPVIHRAMQVCWEAGPRSTCRKNCLSLPFLTDIFFSPLSRGVWWEMMRPWLLLLSWSLPFSMGWLSSRTRVHSN